MADTSKVRFESRMLIDGTLVGGRASGIARQNGRAGFDQYAELKSVAYPAV
jgi:hypothetical protein